MGHLHFHTRRREDCPARWLFNHQIFLLIDKVKKSVVRVTDEILKAIKRFLFRPFVAAYMVLWVAILGEFTIPPCAPSTNMFYEHFHLLGYPIPHCQAMIISINTACIVGMATTSFLFLKRAQAIFSEHPSAHWYWIVFYIAAMCTGIAQIFGITAEHIPGTGYCTMYKVKLYSTITYCIPGVFDTGVFIAISYKIAYQAHQSDFDPDKNWASRLFTSKTLPILSKAILQGGQQFYL